MSFDVFGRLQHVKQILDLPDVLKPIVLDYVGYEVCPAYSTCFYIPDKCHFLGIVDSNVYWQQDFDIYCNNTLFFTHPNIQMPIVHVKGPIVVLGSLMVVNTETKQILLEVHVMDYEVCGKYIYYITQNRNYVYVYDVDTNKTIEHKLESDAWKVFRMHDTITVLDFEVDIYRVNGPTIRRQLARQIFTYQIFKGVKYFLSSYCVMCPTRKFEHRFAFGINYEGFDGFDGYITFTCGDHSRYVWDLNTLKIVKVECPVLDEFKHLRFVQDAHRIDVFE